MCGIAGLWLAQHGGALDLEQSVRAMTRAIEHRGPDGEGVWQDAAAGLCLGHRRLAILDLSDAGRQPMRSESGRFTITFNGEIYNHRRIRTELEARGHRFRGHGDTETALAAVEQWGVTGAIERFIGMFAFAVWDRLDRELWLARDRLGKKPLYYQLGPEDLAFGSELKALLAWPRFEGRVDAQSVAGFLRYGYVPSPQSIFAGTRKLGAGCITRIRRDAAGRLVEQCERYWNPSEVFSDGRASRRTVSMTEAASELRGVLADAVRLRLESDVPLGAFLSGGIDSSVIVALMQAESSRPVRTFTIGFEEGEFDEARHAREVARHLGTDHTETYIDPSQLLHLVPRLPAVFDEPFGDSSQLPMLLVSQIARRHVTVVLSGDGGDEVFGGYRRYQRFWQAWKWLSRVPAPGRLVAARVALAVAAIPLGRGWNLVDKALPGDIGGVTVRQQLRKIAELSRLDGLDAFYERQLAHWSNPGVLVPHAKPPWFDPIPGAPGRRASRDDCFERMMETDLHYYLPDDILVKVDRATMSTGLEARAPLLDHRVVEFAATLPTSLRVAPGSGKRVLRQLAYQLVPKEILDRPKQGFGVPMADWLRGPLRDWADDLLAESSLRRSALLEPAAVVEAWAQHRAGRSDCSAQLWDVLMLQAWHMEHLARRLHRR